jgi:hypothetical protein
MRYPFVLNESHIYDSLWVRSRPGGWSRTFNLLDGTPRKQIWEPVPMWRSPAKQRKFRGQMSDISGLGGMGLGFSERALEVLTPLVGDVIEALPLDCPDCKEKFFAINVLDLVDCLDEARCDAFRFRDGRICWIDRYAFRPGSTEGHHLFKVMQVPIGDALVSPEFKQLVEESGLVGAMFHEVGVEADLAKN